MAVVEDSKDGTLGELRGGLLRDWEQPYRARLAPTQHGICASMGSGEQTVVEALLGALVDVDRTQADDLLLAVGEYTDNEMHEVARSGSSGLTVGERLSRIGRRQLLRETLERELV